MTGGAGPPTGGGGASSAGRGPWTRFKAALDAAGFHPSRRLGQNFLLDENMVRAIVRDAGVGPGDRVLEVGAGCGFLTWHLLERGVELLSIEVDRRLHAIAGELCAELAERGPGSLRLVRADALAGKHVLAPEVRELLPAEGPWHVVANLPYSISAPLLVVLASLPNPPVALTVLVQLEVAERIAAEPATRAWGPLSVRLQLDHAVELVRRVPPELFWPRPSVDSALVRLVRGAGRGGAPAPATAERAALERLVAALFQRRRQGLARVVGETLGDRARARAILAELGLDPRRRGETLSVDELGALARALPPPPPPEAS